MLTVRDVARRTGRNAETVRRWIWDGKLPARKIGNQLFVDEGDLAHLTGSGESREQRRERRIAEAKKLVAELREDHRKMAERGVVPMSGADLIERLRSGETFEEEPEERG